jgi:UDP-N-acetylmuramate-alanine ligase
MVSKALHIEPDVRITKLSGFVLVKQLFASHFLDKFTHTQGVAVEMIRIFQHGDHVVIAEIFTSAVHEIASEVYSPEQCLAWSSREVNYEHWKKRWRTEASFCRRDRFGDFGFSRT